MNTKDSNGVIYEPNHRVQTRPLILPRIGTWAQKRIIAAEVQWSLMFRRGFLKTPEKNEICKVET